ncbi:hypothetical protein C0992_004021 [Termitomyces sp. T32_za158]|nr:hypothetical protein C0992_004021 [Termitomyces sp. T32_za158]
MSEAEIIDVTLCVLALPPLENPVTFDANTPLEQASREVFKPINEYFAKITGKQPEHQDEYISGSIQADDKHKRLGDLMPDEHPLPIVVVRTLKDPKFLPRLVDTAAVGRDALEKSVLSMDETGEAQVASKKGKKKKKPAAPAVPTSPDDLSQLVSRLVSQIAEMDERFVAEKIKSDKDKVKLKESVRLLQEDKVKLEESVRLLQEDKLKSDERDDSLQQQLFEGKRENERTVNDLKRQMASDLDRFKETEKGMRDIYRRIILDNARTQLLAMTGINREDLEPAGLLAAVKAKLPKSFVLSHATLEMIFISGPIRRRGNTAAHEGPQDAIGVAILGTDLKSVERQMLIDVFKFVYGEEPTLDMFN